MSIAILTAAVRRLIAAETARYLCPRSERANEVYAQAWFAAVKANGGCSYRLSRISHYAAIARIRRLAVGLTLCAAANDNARRSVSL